MSPDIASFLSSQESPNWQDPRLMTLVLGESYTPPRMYPDPSTWITPYLRDFVTITDKPLCSMQMDMFSEDNTQTQLYKCSLGNFYLHENADDFAKVIEQMILDKRPVAVDIETNGLSFYENYIRTVQVCNDGETSHILLCEKVGNAARKPLQRLLTHCPTIFQNGTFDTGFLLMFTGVFPHNYCFDTLIASQNIDAGLFEAKDRAFNLGALAKRYLNIEVDKSQQKSFAKTFGQPLSMEQLRYASNDTIATWRIAMIQAHYLDIKKLWSTFKELDMPCCAISVDIKVRGVPIDKDALIYLRDKNQPVCDALEQQLATLLEISPEFVEQDFAEEALNGWIEDITDSNIDVDIVMPTIKSLNDLDMAITPENLTRSGRAPKAKGNKTGVIAKSHQKLLEAFHRMGHTGLESTAEGAIGSYFLGKAVRQVNNEEREIIRAKCEAAGALLDHREIAKSLDYIVKGYLNKFYNPKTGCIHPNLNVCGSLTEGSSAGKDVATGRFSCIAKGTSITVAPEGKTYFKATAIENVLAGDMVYGFDENQNLCTRKVLWAGKTGHKQVIRICWKGKKPWQSGHLDCTPEHKIRLSTGTYLPAQELKAGNSILALQCARTVTRIEKIDISIDVYDLEVEEIHNFIANEVCVHNSNSPNFQNCFTPDTEVLTLEGWVQFEALTDKDKIAQYDYTCKEITFVVPQKLIKQRYTGDMLRIHTEHGIDMCVTPDHECLLRHRFNNKHLKVKASEYKNDYHQLHGGMLKHPGTHLTDDQITVIAALQADGSITISNAIDWGFCKIRKFTRLTKALEKCNIIYKELHTICNIDGGNKHHVFVAKSDVPEWLQNKKCFGSWLLLFDDSTIHRLADEIFFWDGDFTRKSTYLSKQKENADWVQILQTLSGRRSYIVPRLINGKEYPYWVANIKHKDYSLTTNFKSTPINYDGYVYCATVDTGNLIIRYNDKVQITGNCPSKQEWRDIFKAPEGYVIIKTDASQQEVRVLAEVSKDPELQKIYIEAGENPVDIYRQVAAAVLQKKPEAVTSDERRIYKVVTLAVGFAASAKTIASSANVPLEEAKKAVAAYFTRFPGVQDLINRGEKEARSRGYLVNSFSGRRRHFDHEKYKGKEYKYRTQGCNFYIQCLAPETKVLTSIGWMPITEADGELVFDGKAWSRATLQGPQSKKVFQVELSSGKTIRCSPDHLFLSAAGNWVRAANLTPRLKLMPCILPNDLLKSTLPLPVYITRVIKTEEYIKMWDLSVDSPQRCFLAEGVLVHNSGAADCGKKALLFAYEKLAKLGCRPFPPVHDEMVFLAPYETANEALALLSQCMIDGSEYYMKTVPMLAEGAIGLTWRKEASYCYQCKKLPDKPKVLEDNNDPDWYYRKGFEDVCVRKHPDTQEYLIICGRCYINLLEQERFK